MEITEVRIKLVDGGAERLLAFCSITIDEAFVVRDLKIIGGPSGPFVAMPSRKLCDRCVRCGGKNYVRARYCSDCGARLAKDRASVDERGRPRLYSDIAHPIHKRARGQFQQAILAAYAEEVAASQREGYVATQIDEMDYEHWGESAAD